MPSPALYRSDLAYIHHAGFQSYAHSAAPGILWILDRAGVHGGTAVDLGCGDGTLLRALAGSGFETVGVEQSRELARIARRRSPQSRITVGKNADFSFPSCDVVTAIGEVLVYRSGRVSERGARKRLLGKIARALRPGGVLLFDFFLLSNGSPISYTAVRHGRDWSISSVATEDPELRLLTREITTFRKVGRQYRRGGEKHVLELYSRGEMLALVRGAGLTARTVRRYGAFELPPRRLAVVARKR